MLHLGPRVQGVQGFRDVGFRVRDLGSVYVVGGCGGECKPVSDGLAFVSFSACLKRDHL